MTIDTTKKRIIKGNKQTNKPKIPNFSARPFCEWIIDAKIGKCV